MVYSIGVHVSKVSNVLDDKTPAIDVSSAITRDMTKLRVTVAQIFSHGPQGTTAVKLDSNVVHLSNLYDIYVHSSYVSIGIWKITKENRATADSKRVYNHIASQLEVCKKIKASGFVLHIAKHYADEITYVMQYIKKLAIKNNTPILLEMVASKSDSSKTYETPEKINNLTKLLGPTEDYWGWVIDTAHIWGAGVNIKTYKAMQEWLDGLVYKKKILLIHLNGSSAECGSGRDKHEIPFTREDLIWGGVSYQNSGLRALIEFTKKHNIPCLFEINRGKQRDAEKVFKLCK